MTRCNTIFHLALHIRIVTWFHMLLHFFKLFAMRLDVILFTMLVKKSREKLRIKLNKTVPVYNKPGQGRSFWNGSKAWCSFECLLIFSLREPWLSLSWIRFGIRKWRDSCLSYFYDFVNLLIWRPTSLFISTDDLWPFRILFLHDFLQIQPPTWEITPSVSLFHRFVLHFNNFL